MPLAVETSCLRSLIKGTIVASAGVYACDVLLPRDDQRSGNDLVSRRTAKEATIFGAVAAIVLAREDPRAIGFGWGAIAGTLIADQGYRLSGSPRLELFDPNSQRPEGCAT